MMPTILRPTKGLRVRYVDAEHVRQADFLARRPVLGRWYLIAGLVAVAILGLAGDHGPVLASVAAVVALLWASAWWLVVGPAWRVSLVAALWLAAVQTARIRWPECFVFGDT